jgi:hypothetical protein
MRHAAILVAILAFVARPGLLSSVWGCQRPHSGLFPIPLSSWSHPPCDRQIPERPSGVRGFARSPYFGAFRGRRIRQQKQQHLSEHEKADEANSLPHRLLPVGTAGFDAA